MPDADVEDLRSLVIMLEAQLGIVEAEVSQLKERLLRLEGDASVPRHVASEGQADA